MKKLITITALLLATATALPASAQTTQPAADNNARLESILRAFEATPSREQLEATIPDAAQHLIQAANDTNRDLFTRLRATSLLTNFQTPESLNALLTLTQNPEPELRRTAYYTLGRTFGNTPHHIDTTQLLNTLERGTRDPHPDVRTHTVRTLRWIQHPNANTLLTSIAQSSTDPALRDLAQLTLTRKTPTTPQ